MNIVKRLAVLIIILFIVGCSTTYETKVISDPPGAKIEVDGGYVGETPCSIIWDGYNHSFDDRHTVLAYPIYAGQQTQKKYFWSRSKIPESIYFNMNLVKVPDQYQINWNDGQSSGGGNPSHDNNTNFIEREGLVYKGNSTIPYTGRAFEGYENGQKLFEGFFRDGKPHGKYIFWYENGQKQAEGELRDGKRHGLWSYWYDSGQKWKEGEWCDDKDHGKWTEWYENGQKKAESGWRDGKLHGKYIFWYENGQKKEEGEYRDGKLHGEGTVWYNNGQKKAEGFFRDGKPHGKYIIWSDTGEILIEAEYRDGELID